MSSRQLGPRPSTRVVTPCRVGQQLTYIAAIVPMTSGRTEPDRPGGKNLGEFGYAFPETAASAAALAGLSGNRDPRLSTVTKIASACGVRIQFVA